MSKKSTITINIQLDAQNVPETIEWMSTDNPQGEEMKDCKGMLLGLFDKDTMDTLKIDLWTKDMQVAEMDRFFYQNFRALADTYFRATQNKELAGQMQHFANYFGEKTEVIPKPTSE
ncbi:MAG: gliding motility protein GldC [Saprospiraceae bacterium]